MHTVVAAALELATTASHVAAYPDLVKQVLADLADILGHHVQTYENPEAVRAMVAGAAASRANAVQEYVRRQTKGTYHDQG